MGARARPCRNCPENRAFVYRHRVEKSASLAGKA
jgi:hypothetical protein